MIDCEKALTGDHLLLVRSIDDSMMANQLNEKL